MLDFLYRGEFCENGPLKTEKWSAKTGIVFSRPKCNIEHTRHRSIENFAVNIFAALIAYNLLPKKPTMNIEIIDKSRLIA